MLPQHRVTSPGGIEEEGSEVPIEEDLEETDGHHRQREQQQEGNHEGHPGEHRHPHQRHAGRPHREDRGDEVHGRGDRGDAEDLQTERPVVHPHYLVDLG